MLGITLALGIVVMVLGVNLGNIIDALHTISNELAQLRRLREWELMKTQGYNRFKDKEDQ